jgi:hypothetical protein
MDTQELIEKVHALLGNYNRKQNVYWFSLKEKINKVPDSE